MKNGKLVSFSVYRLVFLGFFFKFPKFSKNLNRADHFR
jgi:hypothetical protein